MTAIARNICSKGTELTGKVIRGGFNQARNFARGATYSLLAFPVRAASYKFL